MDPYTSPSTPPDNTAQPDVPIEEHRLYGMVLKMVLWGEKKEEVYHRLQVNGLTGPTADRLYQHAWSDRIATIRSACRHKFLFGIGLILAATITFCVCWFGLQLIPRLLLYACFAALGIGLWKTIDGAAGYLMAANKEGSVAEEL